ncbi:MAG TPA: hypothetical protein VIL97_03725, partial [Thermoanaerobaculia bacterium]
PLSDFAVVGGELEHHTAPDSGISYASLPGHSDKVALRAAMIAEAADAAREAWSGIDPLRDAIVVETPPRFHTDRFQAMVEQNWFETSQASGKLFRLLEADLTSDEFRSSSDVAGVALASELTQRRAIAVEHSSFFRFLYRELARERLGKGPPQRAVVGPNGAYEAAILKGGQWYTAAYRQRLPAVLADIENRVGSRLFDDAIEQFINTRSAVPATARDFVSAIERESGVSLETMWRDYFVGDGVPQLTLDGVEFTRRGDEWIVTGSLRNKGIGEARCPLVLRTDFESAQTIVTVDTNASRPFTLRTPYHPRTLQLDPENVCYRFAAIGLIDRVEYEGAL